MNTVEAAETVYVVLVCSLRFTDRRRSRIQGYVDVAALGMYTIILRVREQDVTDDGGIAILYFDYALTLCPEMECIWRHPTSRTSIIFYINRYIPIFSNIAVLVYR